jgi:hypothetical protein
MRKSSTLAITVSAAAAQLGVSVQRVRILLKRGRIAGAHKHGRDWIIPLPVRVLPGSRRCPGKIQLDEPPGGESIHRRGRSSLCRDHIKRDAVASRGDHDKVR